MKKSFHNQIRNSLALAVVALAAFTSTTSMAEPLNPAVPSVTVADAKLVGQPVQPAKPVKTAAHSAPVEEPTTVAKIKVWVDTAVHEVKTYFWGDDQPPVLAAQPAKPQPPLPRGGRPDVAGRAPAQDQNAPAAVTVAPAAVAPTGGAGVAPVAAVAPSQLAHASAPALASAPAPAQKNILGLTKKSTGVVAYDLSASPKIPRLAIESENKVSAADYRIDSRLSKILDDRMIHILATPMVMNQGELQHFLSKRTENPGGVLKVRDITTTQHGKVSRAEFDKVILNLRPEAALALKKYTPLTAQETLFLSGLLLYQQGEQCPSALGLFHKLAKVKGWEAESNFYLAMCSKQISLMSDFYERARRVLLTQDVYYSKKVLGEVGFEIPYELSDGFGEALLKVSANPKIMDGLKPDVLANVAFLIADLGVSSEHFKTALEWAQKVPASHPKYLKAQFLQALAEYQAGSKVNAIKIQDKIINDKSIDKSNLEFQALVALNAGRMHFQDQNFKEAHEDFQKVYKDHPLWLQSLTEMGWAQLMDGDFEGAIGNMYSIQSPFFSAVYKPESYVIRTIGYLNLCQYGDAYKTLSILEHDYRPYLAKMESYIARAGNQPLYFQTVRNFIATSAKAGGEVDGLPSQIVREMARHRDFTNLQKSLNRLIDERPNYAKVNGEVERSLKRAQADVTGLRGTADGIRKRLKAAVTHRDVAARDDAQKELDKALNNLNDAFFKVDLFTAAKAGMDEYRSEVVTGADLRIASVRKNVEHVLANRLLKMKVDLARMLENNELLRYEVFAGSGENLRFQVAGGNTGKRVPASILPKSKSLQWEFDGEYWEDEIGHYRSSLKNNCADSRAQASLDGGNK